MTTFCAICGLRFELGTPGSRRFVCVRCCDGRSDDIFPVEPLEAVEVIAGDPIISIWRATPPRPLWLSWLACGVGVLLLVLPVALCLISLGSAVWRMLWLK